MRPRRFNRSIVAIAHAQQATEALDQALALLPLPELIGPEDTVVVTVNLVQPRPASTATVASPEELRHLLRRIKSFRPARLVVAAGSGGAPTPQVVRETGFEPVLADEQVEFVDLNCGPYLELKLDQDPEVIPARTPVNRLYAEMTVHVSLTPLKIHAEATMTATLKNVALSWPPAEIHGFPKTQRGIHERLHPFIAAMARQLPVDLSLVSASPAMVGTGPAAGKPVFTGLFLAGTDPVATDVVAARLLGFMPQAVQYLYRAIAMGLGEGDLKKVELRGLPLDQAELLFSQAAYGHAFALDQGRLQPLQAK
ncbi:MAG: DUF362 domain-containing protein [Moorellales bacterium]